MRIRRYLSLAIGILISGQILIGIQIFAQEQLSLSTDWSSYGTESSKLKNSQGISAGRDGRVYIADTGNNRIQIFSSDGVFEKSWGSYGSSGGSFRLPEGIAIDSQGSLYVADTGNHRIQKFDSNGTLITSLGGYGSGEGKLKNPQGIALDLQNNLYVADTGNNRIQVFDFEGKPLRVIGSIGAGNGTVKYPEDVAVDSSGDIYIADTINNRIQKFDRDGNFVLAWGSYGEGNGYFISPRGIAADNNGFVYVADSGNHRIQKFFGNGTFVAKVGNYGKFEGQLNVPSDVTVDTAGRVYVIDSGNHRILQYTSGVEADYIDLVNLGADGNPGLLDPNLEVELFAEGLALPTSIAFLDEEDLLILQKSDTQVRRIVNGVMLDDPVLDIGLGYLNGCMCGIAVSDDVNEKRFVFLYFYVLGPSEGIDRNPGAYLYRYEFLDGKLVNPLQLLFLPTSEKAIHLGGKLLIGPDNNVYLTMGDMDGHKTKAQNVEGGPEPDGTSGILWFDQQGQPVVNNKSLGTEGLTSHYYAYGIRNSFGIDFDPVSGYMWDTENGPDYGDEINLVPQSFNSGWNNVQGMSSITSQPDQLYDFGGRGTYSDPAFEWKLPIGPTAVKFLDSIRYGESYHNDMFVGDINNGHLYHFELNENRTALVLEGSLADKVANNIQERERAVFGTGFFGISDIIISPDGFMYIVSLAGGKVYKVEPLTT